MQRAHNYYSEDGYKCDNFFGWGIIEKIIFFYFEGPLKNFFGASKPYLGHTSKAFDPSIGLGVGNVRNSPGYL